MSLKADVSWMVDLVAAFPSSASTATAALLRRAQQQRDVLRLQYCPVDCLLELCQRAVHYLHTRTHSHSDYQTQRSDQTNEHGITKEDSHDRFVIVPNKICDL